MEEDESKPHIIIDNGGGSIKAGFSFEEGPKAVFPTMIGYPKNQVDNIFDKKNIILVKMLKRKKKSLN